MIPMQRYTSPRPEAKTARKELKLQPSVLELIKTAARNVGMDPSTFIATAAFERAQEIERSRQMTLLPDAQFKAFADAVEREGRNNAALSESIARGRALFGDG